MNFFLLFQPMEVIVSWITAFCALRSMELLLPQQKKLWKRILMLLGLWFLSNMVIFVGDPVNLVPSFIAFMIVAMVCSDGPWLQRFTVGLMVANLLFAFNAIQDNSISPHWVLRFMPKLMFWGVFYLLLRRFAPPKNFELSSSLWRLLIMLTATPLGILFILVIVTDPYYVLTGTVKQVFISLLVLSLFSFVGLIWTTTILAKQRAMEQKTFLADMNKIYYEAMEQQQFEVRRLRHDMANHLQVLSSLTDNERDKYLDRLIQSPAMENSLHYCGDATVNAVLGAKVSMAKQNGIKVNIKADIPEELPLVHVDVCAVFANAFDNAIEACIKLDLDNRWIELRTKAQKNMLVISVENAVTSQDILENNSILPQTTKKDASHHGYGLRSIKEIVGRYDGSLEVKIENGVFKLFVYMMMCAS